MHNTEYMFSKLCEISFNRFSDGEISEEESESYMDELQLMSPNELEEEYNNVFEKEE